MNTLSLPEEVPPQLVAFWKVSSEPWAFKNTDSQYRYANPAFLELLGLPLEFDIVDKRDNELPVSKPSDRKLPYLDFTQFSQQYRDYEALATETHQTVSSIETHCFGKERKIQPYIFNRTPVLDSQKNAVGIMLNAQPMSFLTPGQYVNKVPPLSLLLDKPDTLFSDEEYEVIFFLLQQMSLENIAEKLQLSVPQVEKLQQEIYTKAKVKSLDASEALEHFTLFCQANGYERYAPQKCLEPSSTMIPLSN